MKNKRKILKQNKFLFLIDKNGLCFSFVVMRSIISLFLYIYFFFLFLLPSLIFFLRSKMVASLEISIFSISFDLCPLVYTSIIISLFLPPFNIFFFFFYYFFFWVKKNNITNWKEIKRRWKGWLIKRNLAFEGFDSKVFFFLQEKKKTKKNRKTKEKNGIVNKLISMFLEKDVWGEIVHWCLFGRWGKEIRLP